MNKRRRPPHPRSGLAVTGIVRATAHEPSKGACGHAGIEPRAVAEVVEETLEECRHLLIIGDTHPRHAEVDQQIATIQRAARAAARCIGHSTPDVTRSAMRRRDGSESEAIALLEATRKASTALQRDLLETTRLREGVADQPHGQLAASLVATPDGEPPARHIGSRRRLHRAAARRVVTLAIFIVTAVALRTFVGAPYTVASTSMTPTLADGDLALVNKVPYHLHPPRRGDTVVIEASQRVGGRLIVKRVVGLPGEHIESIDGQVRVDGELLDEHYLDDGVSTASFGPLVVTEAEVFVLGDNRALSLDSRVFGPVPIGEVIGRVDAVIWPLTELRPL